MSEKGSVFQKGGGGTNYEQYVQAAFLVELIIRGSAPCLPHNEITEVSFQNTKYGFETDDLRVTAISTLGTHTLLFQIKHDISLTSGNKVFKEVIAAFWKDFKNPTTFDKDKDKLILVKNGLTKDERNDIKTLVNWANHHASAADFLLEVSRVQNKTGRLGIFKGIIREFNEDQDPTDQQLWQFMRCFDLLEYDFLNTGSVDENHILNVIKLAKAKTASSNAQDIWNEVLVTAAQLNKDGGNETTVSIQQHPLYRHFAVEKLQPYISFVEKLKNDGETILLPFKNTVSGINLPRNAIHQNIAESIRANEITIVTGKPGVGKSAAIKDALKQEFPNANIFVFRADQFNKPNLSTVLSEIGMTPSVPDIFSCIALVPERIIFIDSLEKLLEADPDCAFQQLLALLKNYPDIKIIGASRKYALDLITMKFNIDSQSLKTIEIPLLTDDELSIIATAFNQLTNILKNPKIKDIVSSPKYLDFAITAIKRSGHNYAELSITDFKQALWNELVVNASHTKNGLPLKRERAFMEIAIKRAREMKLFTSPISADPEAIQFLEQDEMLFQESYNRKYAPSHDILEDWALTKYIAEQTDQFSEPKALFKSIGNEPAIRRAFRLWVEDALVDDQERILELTTRTLQDPSLEPYWSDELMIAIFKSNSSEPFFKSFSTSLMKDKAKLLNRCLHLLKTACKESKQLSDAPFLLPVGSGWKQALLFIEAHLTDLQPLRLPIINVLTEWHWKLSFKKEETDEQELNAVKNIVLYYIKEAEAGEAFWLEKVAENGISLLIEVLFDLAPIARDDIERLIHTAVESEDKKLSWQLGNFYEEVLKKCLAGFGNSTLLKELPDLVIDTAWKVWKEKPIKIEKGDMFGRMAYRDRDAVESWGITNHMKFYPAGIYKTPFYQLLWNHRDKALKFIVEFINYTVDYHRKAKTEYKQTFEQIEIELNDGTKVLQWGSDQLWKAYRDSSVVHSAVVSLLMGLEKFMLEIAKLKHNQGRKILNQMFQYLLRSSNNVATAGVLCSVAMAYPTEVKEAMLPLLRCRRFYEWDTHRVLDERNALAPMDTEIAVAQKERYEFNQLPHRTRFMRGLRDFILNYQFNIREINSDIHKIFDQLKEQPEAGELWWNKALTEMDIRNHEFTPHESQPGVYLVEPKYDKQVTEYLDSQKEADEAENEAARYGSLIRNAYEQKHRLEFQEWQRVYNYYSTKTGSNFFFDRPLSCAHCGLRDFGNVLGKKEKQWCISILCNCIDQIAEDASNRNFMPSLSANPMDRDAVFSSFHLILGVLSNKKDKIALKTGVLRLLTTPHVDLDTKRLFTYFRTVFFISFPEEAKLIWLSVIAYARNRKTNHFYYDDPDTAKIEKAKKKELQLLRKLSSQRTIDIDWTTINLQTCHEYWLYRVLLMTPINTKDPEFDNFIFSFIPLVTEDLSREENYSFRPSSRERHFHHEQISEIESYLANLLLNANRELSQPVFNLIFDPLKYMPSDSRRRRNDLKDFSSSTIQYVIAMLNDLLRANPEEGVKNRVIDNFSTLWEHFYERTKATENYELLKLLFMDVGWSDTSRHWDPMSKVKDTYKRIIDEYGSYRLQSLLNVISTIGDQTFLPKEMLTVVNFLKEDSTQVGVLISAAANTLIKKLFYHHITKIKSDPHMIQAFIWILNKMTDLGSSDAYFFRENVITYKRTN